MAQSEKSLGATQIEKAEHIEVNGVPAKRVLMSGFDGTNINDINIDSSGELQVDVLSSALPSGAATETTLADIKTAVQTLDNFISGSRGLVTEDNSAAILERTKKVCSALEGILDAIKQTIDMANYRQRVTAILESTTLTTCSTVTTLGSVGTTNIPQAQDMVLGANLTAWAMCCRERIS